MDFVHSEVPETNAGRPQRRGQESNLCLPESKSGATTNSCRLGEKMVASAPSSFRDRLIATGIAEKCPAGIEPA
ncbi:hypothetical protein [Rhodopirellula bahusiensis]|uniref:hypothetical protein n=1 Tax=Rhodopirellula bahusiensis TaxID=2014065 RepID=UPI0013044F0E|nr:hypothetical protein [Rhodopirellula bahusiensis]